jgi:hypothetical protein
MAQLTTMGNKARIAGTKKNALVDNWSDEKIATMARLVSEADYGGRCAALDDAILCQTYRLARQKGLTEAHAIETCALLRPGDDADRLAGLVLDLKRMLGHC